MHDQHFRLYGAVDSSGALLGGLGGQSAVEITEQGDVLVIVVRTLMGDIADEAALATWVAGAVDHFSHDKILVDLRGNGGGNDGHTWNWAEPYLSRASAGWCRSRGWMVGDREAGYWNAAVWYELQLGVDNVPPSLLAGRHQPDSTDQLTPDVTDLAPGPTPWDGRMVIAVDGDTGSSGESSYWLLRHGFNAVGVGAPTKGMMEFGNIVRYVFSRSGFDGVPSDQAQRLRSTRRTRRYAGRRHDPRRYADRRAGGALRQLLRRSTVTTCILMTIASSTLTRAHRRAA